MVYGVQFHFIFFNNFPYTHLVPRNVINAIVSFALDKGDDVFHLEMP